MFKFDFKVDEVSEESTDAQPEGSEDLEKPTKKLKIEEVVPEKCEEILFSDDLIVAEHMKGRPLETFTSDDYHIFTVEPIETELTRSSHSDLISGVYEGGLKVWECTQDLADFFTSRPELLQSLKDKKVLDLGCGAGVLGILCATAEAAVTFQDYNKEVLITTTAINVLCNKDVCEEIDVKRCRLFSGDWDEFSEKLHSQDETFDVILTSETIYNVDYYPKLITCFRRLLKDSGSVYLAAKTYYFGVGGGLRSFEAALGDEFEHKVVWKCTSGVAREILEIKKKG